MKSNLKFFYNGIKANGGKLQKAHYSKGRYTPESGIPEGTITIYGKDYVGFSSEVRAEFTVENNTDTMTDYFEQDRIKVLATHPLYALVDAAWLAQETKRSKRYPAYRSETIESPIEPTVAPEIAAETVAELWERLNKVEAAARRIGWIN